MSTLLIINAVVAFGTFLTFMWLSFRKFSKDESLIGVYILALLISSMWFIISFFGFYSNYKQQHYLKVLNNNKVLSELIHQNIKMNNFDLSAASCNDDRQPTCIAIIDRLKLNYPQEKFYIPTLNRLWFESNKTQNNIQNEVNAVKLLEKQQAQIITNQAIKTVEMN